MHLKHSVEASRETEHNPKVWCWSELLVLLLLIAKLLSRHHLYLKRNKRSFLMIGTTCALFIWAANGYSKLRFKVRLYVENYILAQISRLNSNLDPTRIGNIEMYNEILSKCMETSNTHSVLLKHNSAFLKPPWLNVLSSRSWLSFSQAIIFTFAVTQRDDVTIWSWKMSQIHDLKS